MVTKRERCPRPAVTIGFCKQHAAELDDYDRAFYARRYKRLGAKLRMGQVSLATYHDRCVLACSLTGR